MKIVSVVGARPQFIKASVVTRLLRKTKGVEEILVHTGQHYDENMSDIFFEELEIPKPEYSLGVGSGSHGAQTGKMLEAVESILLKLKPDRVLVYGDTNSTLAGALAAAKLRIPVAHVEAGLRSFNRAMPEETNRVVTDHVSDILFAPTPLAVKNLRKEGIPTSKIHRVGDVMYDVAVEYGQKAEGKSRILETMRLSPKGYVLATIHRAENTDDPARLRAVFEGLDQVARNIPVVLPLHPRTRAVLAKAPREKNGMLQMIDPVGYLDMLRLEKNAVLIATDSGGVQKEAYFYRVSCVTLRDETEWVELVDLGWNRVVPPTSADRVSSSILRAIGKRGRKARLYGDGNSAKQIVDILIK